MIALNSEQLNLLTFDKVFENSLPLRLKKAKDIFVFGCITGLRISDLLSLNKTNLEYNYSDVHLVITSQKTRHYSRIKLPGFAITILKRYQYHKTLLPHLHPYTLNKYFREIAIKAGWVNPVAKIRLKRGMPIEIRPGNQNEHFRFCDLITTHTMRRTAITNMLNMGMPEHLVRRISGHSQSSKEFFRYVQYSQVHIDKELDKVFEQMNYLKDFPNQSQI